MDAILDTTEVYVSSGNISVEAIKIASRFPNGNFTGKCVHKKPYFDLRTECYNSEKLLYSKLSSGLINERGVTLLFFIVDYSKMYDVIFREDNDRTVIRKFPIKGMFDLSSQDREISLMGIHETDTFHIFVNKDHFTMASRLDHQGNRYRGYLYEAYTPKTGDVIKSSHNNTYYQVLDCRDERDIQFHQTRHHWDITVRVMRNNRYNINTSNSETLQDISQELLKNNDALSANEEIDTKVEQIKYNPFGEW